MDIQVKPLTQEAFKKWGQLILPGQSDGLTKLTMADYVGNAAVCNFGAEVSVSILSPWKRPVQLRVMECHRETPELCVSTKGDSVIFVAADKNGTPDLASVESFLAPEGCAVVYNACVWHWVPYPVGESSNHLIIYKNNTGKTDFYKQELSQPITTTL